MIIVQLSAVNCRSILAKIGILFQKLPFQISAFTPSSPSNSAGSPDITASKLITEKNFFAKTARARRSDFGRGGRVLAGGRCPPPLA